MLSINKFDKFDCLNVYDDIRITFSEFENQIFDDFIKYKDILSNYEDLQYLCNSLSIPIHKLSSLPCYFKNPEEISMYQIIANRKKLFLNKCEEFYNVKYLIPVNKFINCKLFIPVFIDGFETAHLTIFFKNQDIYVDNLIIKIDSSSSFSMSINPNLKESNDKVMKESNDNVKFLLDFNFNFKKWYIKKQSFCGSCYYFVAMPNNVNDILQFKNHMKLSLSNYIKDKFFIIKLFKTLFGDTSNVFDLLLQTDIQDRINQLVFLDTYTYLSSGVRNEDRQ